MSSSVCVASTLHEGAAIASLGLRELGLEAPVLGELLLERRALALHMGAGVGGFRACVRRVRFDLVGAHELLGNAHPLVCQALREARVPIIACDVHAMSALESQACFRDGVGAELLRVGVALEVGHGGLGERAIVSRAGGEHEGRCTQHRDDHYPPTKAHSTFRAATPRAVSSESVAARLLHRPDDAFTRRSWHALGFLGTNIS